MMSPYRDATPYVADVVEVRRESHLNVDVFTSEARHEFEDVYSFLFHIV